MLDIGSLSAGARRNSRRQIMLTLSQNGYGPSADTLGTSRVYRSALDKILALGRFVAVSATGQVSDLSGGLCPIDSTGGPYQESRSS